MRTAILILTATVLAACDGEPEDARADGPARFEHDYAVDCGGDPPAVWHLSLSEPMDARDEARFCDCMSGVDLATASPAGQMANQTTFMRCLTELVEIPPEATGGR